MTRLHATALAWPAALLLAAGCATPPEEAEPITWSADWFVCDSSFECVAVYDAYCKFTGVNANHSLVYQDWAHQQVAAIGEVLPCEPVTEDRPLRAYCRSSRCEYP